MLATTDRETALRLLDVEHEAVRALIDELTETEMLQPDTIRYGLYPDQKLSFKDLLAHLITYEAYAIEAISAWQQGEKHWIIDAMDSPLGSREVHYQGIECRREFSLATVLEEWDTTQTQLKAVIQGLSDAEWHAPAPFATPAPLDLGGMLEAILVAPPRPLYRHLPVHIPDSEVYIRTLRR
ncbi:MAG: DinB family protein [Anaerolineae bacterium]|nr:DinB family protein [Anaerolineae bacterium]